MNSRGVALLMGLVLLAAIGLLALMATSGMVLQRHMSANFSESGRALAAADAADAAARAWLYSRADSERERDCETDCMLPVAIHGRGELPWDPGFESAAWWRDNGVAAGTDPQSGDAAAGDADASAPRWIIEELYYLPLDGSSEPAIGGIGYYRILARSSGRSPGSIAVTESVVARPWEGEFEPLSYPVDAPPGVFCRQFGTGTACGTQAWRQRR